MLWLGRGGRCDGTVLAFRWAASVVFSCAVVGFAICSGLVIGRIIGICFTYRR